MKKENQFLTLEEEVKVTHYYSIELTDMTIEIINDEIKNKWQQFQEKKRQPIMTLPSMTKESLITIWKNDIAKIKPNAIFWQTENNNIEFKNRNKFLDFISVAYSVLRDFVNDGECVGCEDEEIIKRTQKVKNSEKEMDKWLGYND